MAKAKTGTFYLTETVVIPNGTAGSTSTQATIDLGAYVNVPTGQAVAIRDVDVVFQHGDSFNGNVDGMLAANGSIDYQLTDLNPGTQMVRADNQSLIASGSLNIDTAANIATHTSDLYPDNFGPASLSEAFMVVNDTLYVNAMPSGAASGTTDVSVSIRIRAQVVKLSQKDWMAIAIQSTAADN
jgi:hypothetical protein